MIVFAIALAVLLVVSNGVWLYYFTQTQRDAARERWSLQERIRDPLAALPNPEPQVSPEETQALDQWLAATEPSDQQEFEAIGRIDPALPDDRENN